VALLILHIPTSWTKTHDPSGELAYFRFAQVPYQISRFTKARKICVHKKHAIQHWGDL